MSLIYRLAIVLSASAAIQSVCAEEFSWQLAGGFQSGELPDTEIDTATLQATWFASPVDDELGPYAVSPFLSRNSSITFAAEMVESRTQISFTPPFGSTVETSEISDESAVYSLAGRHVWRNSGWYLGAGLQRYDLTDSDSTLVSVDRKADGYSLTGGKYLGPSTALEVSFDSVRRTTDYTLRPCPPTSFCPPNSIAVDSKIETENVRVAVTHVGGGTRLRYSLSGAIVETDSTFSLLSEPVVADPGTFNPRFPSGFPGGGVVVVAIPAYVPGFTTISIGAQREYSIAGTLYPTDRLGARIGFSKFTDAGALDDRYEIAATWFFKRKVAVEFAIARTNQRFLSSSVEQDEARVRLIGRL